MNKEEVKGAIESLLQDENIKNGAYSFIGETNICYADIHILLKQLQAYKDKEDKIRELITAPIDGMSLDRLGRNILQILNDKEV